jgi:hypothetical protein
MCVNKAGAYPSEAPFKGSTRGQAFGLILGSKGLSRVKLTTKILKSPKYFFLIGPTDERSFVNLAVNSLFRLSFRGGVEFDSKMFDFSSNFICYKNIDSKE